jgi:NADH-quinone oxidoreductase subunit C
MANDPSEKKPQPAGDAGEATPASPEQPPEQLKLDASEPAKPAAPEATALEASGPAAAEPAKPVEQELPKPAAAEPAKPVAPRPASSTPAAPGAPAAKPAAPAVKKEEPPKPVPLENELVARFKGKFASAIREAWLDRKQAILVVEREHLGAICRHARDDESFDYLVDLTAVDWPKREKRFDVVLFLYSFKKNERLRIKVHAAEGETVPSVVTIWGAANWLEREVFDMFGIRFAGHPNLTRILLPEEWQGYPLRKDYDILTQDTAWVRENLGIESGQ